MTLKEEITTPAPKATPTPASKATPTPAPTPTSQQIRVQKIQRTIVFLMMILFWFSLYVHVPFQTKYLEDIGVSAGGIGMIVGIYGMAQFLFRLPLGMIADRTRSFMRFVLAGVILNLITSWIRMAFPSASGMFGANVLAGFAAANWIVMMVYYLSLFTADEVQYGTTTSTLAFTLGQMAATWAGAKIFSHSKMIGLAKAEVIAAVLSVVLGLGLYGYLHLKVRKGEISTWQAGFCQKGMVEKTKGLQYKDLLRSLYKKRTIGFAFLTFIQQGLMMTTALSFTTKQAVAIGAQGAEIGYATLIFLGVTVIVNFLIGRPFFVRIGARRLLPLFLTLATFYCFFLPCVQSIMGLYLMQCLGGIFSGGTLPLLLSESLEGVKAHQRMTAMGFVQAILAGGIIVLPPVTGLLIEYYDLATAFRVLAAGTALVVVYTIWLYRSLEKSEARGA